MATWNGKYTRVMDLAAENYAIAKSPTDGGEGGELTFSR
jgi:hypothetical protein